MLWSLIQQVFFIVVLPICQDIKKMTNSAQKVSKILIHTVYCVVYTVYLSQEENKINILRRKD